MLGPHSHLPLPPSALSPQFTVEASPSYMLMADTLASIAIMMPHVKIIASLREPVERMLSE
jgi:hypothetical protein